MKYKHTPGDWRIGKHGSVVTDAPGQSNRDVIEFYGGEVICESIKTIDDALLIHAAPAILEALIDVYLYYTDRFYRQDKEERASHATDGNTTYRESMMERVYAAITKTGIEP